MSNIAIVYFSKGGATRTLAKTIQTGIESTSCNARLFEIESRDIKGGRYVNDELLSSLKHFDAIIFGSPTYMVLPVPNLRHLWMPVVMSMSN